MRFPWRALSILMLLARPAFADCAADLQSVLAKHIAAGPYRVESAFTLDSKPMRTTAEVVLPDRFHLRLLFGEAIFIGNAMWLAKGDGQWAQSPAVPAEQRMQVYEDLSEQLRNARDVACLGPVAFGTKSYLGYRFTSQRDVNGKPVIWVSTLYVDPATGLAARQEVNADTRQPILMTFTFDPSIKIEAPQ
jgi:hypothetical protein